MVELKTILSLDIFKDLDDAALVDIAEHASIEKYQENDRLVAERMTKFMLYLLEGNLDLQTTGGVHHDMSAGSERTKNPIFYSDVSGHYARCTTPCKVLQIKKTLIDKYGIKHKRDKDDLDFAAFDTLTGNSNLSLMNEITALFKSKSVTLPSLPEIALYIRTAIEKEDINTSKLAKIIQMDPVIAARVVQVANSSVYGGGPRCDSIQQAISRIGLEGLRTIVMGVVLRDLFMPNTEVVIKSMAHFYEHSIRIGVISYELARRIPGFDPDQAFLAGILHDIGVVPVLMVADNHSELAYKKSNLDAVLVQLKSYIGGMILQQWAFDDVYIEIAKHAYDWNRKVDRADYCDLIQVALMHSHLVGGEKIPGPALHELPAFIRLGLDKENPVANLHTLKGLGVRITDLIRMICK